MKASLYGLSLATHDAAVAERGGVNAQEHADLTVALGHRSESRGGGRLWYRSPWRSASGAPGLEVEALPGGAFRWLYADGTEFEVDARGTHVSAAWSPASTLEDALVYLLGPVLGFVLRLRGVTCLHASAVAVRDRALVFVGGAGAGKSTTAAAFAKRGFAVLTDDVTALAHDGVSFLVQPGLPRVLLWPESAEALWPSPAAMPRLVSGWEKRYLDLSQPGFRFCREPQRMGAVYVLESRRKDATTAEFAPLAGTAGLMRLVANTYANHLIDGSMRADELEVLGRLMAAVPVRSMEAPDDCGALPDLCDAILRDFEALASSA
jgi:hypothetical protein